jgi:hypothetical protein
MIVALTTASLDITLGVAWWTLKQLVSGTIYLGTYLFSESTATKKNKILGDDVNFVPHAFPVVDLEVAHSHMKHPTTETEGFININHTEVTKDKYFCIPIADFIERKDNLPLWAIPFLNTYPLTNYSIVQSSEKLVFTTTEHDTPIFSPFTLTQHLLLKQTMPRHLCIYLKHDDVDKVISSLITACR